MYLEFFKYQVYVQANIDRCFPLPFRMLFFLELTMKIFAISGKEKACIFSNQKEYFMA